MDLEEEQEIEIGSSTLHYRINSDKYIITYLNDYNGEITASIDDLFEKIYPGYDTGELKYRNVCGDNTTQICKTITDKGYINGKIIITDWVVNDDTFSKNKDAITSVYGNNEFVLLVSYHALPYFEIIIDVKTYYVAIETVICTPYKLQFYVGKTEEEIEEILKTRYQCNSIELKCDCDEMWYSHLMSSKKGGIAVKKKRKTKKRKTARRRNRKSYRKRNNT